ncbi:DUF397 domain-containing protein [Streptomyces sp. NPDC001941]|uniref:DUF397 domain-containing protein n=1 Tax=Streptomyces sp. NPDC001941 TaxID=3154659 RepID=UPI00331AFE86
MPTVPNWHKSSFSSGATNDCVECSTNTPAVMVRDTKDHAMGVIEASHSSWALFTAFAASEG